MKKSLITSGLLALAMLSASSAFAEANCQAHPKNEQIPQADFQKALEKHGFTIVKQKRMWFDSFYVSMLSTQYQSKKINYLIAILVGVCSTVASIFHKEKCSSLIYILQKK